jgi:hypothetical protein
VYQKTKNDFIVLFAKYYFFSVYKNVDLDMGSPIVYVNSPELCKEVSNDVDFPKVISISFSFTLLLPTL